MGGGGGEVVCLPVLPRLTVIDIQRIMQKWCKQIFKSAELSEIHVCVKSDCWAALDIIYQRAW